MFLELLQNRRSIRQFKPDPLSPEQIEQLSEALLRAPSSRGLNPWHFVVIDDPQLLGRLAHAKAHGAEFLAGAPLAIAIWGDVGGRVENRIRHVRSGYTFPSLSLDEDIRF